MSSQLPSTQGELDAEFVQGTLLEQAQAAVASEPDVQDDVVMLQNTDLLEADEIPPPAYGETYGEIQAEKDGLSTSASVADDGRVNIRINQFTRRLSQIFAPDLRELGQAAQDESLSINTHTPSIVEGKLRSSLPPPLNIVIQVVGSRGDIQPFISLGKVLKDTYGHRVRLATHPTFKSFVQEHGVEFFSIGGDPSRLMAYMVKNPGLMPGFRSVVSGDVGRRRRDVADYIQGCWRSCYQAGDGMGSGASESDLAHKPFVADCIIANPPSFAHIHCAEKLGIPLHIMNPMPYSPTQAFPHPLANIQSTNADPQLTNYVSYAMIEVLTWQGLGDIINRFRTKCLGLDPVSLIWAPTMLQRLRVPHTYCWSPALLPQPKDWRSHISIAGFYLLDSSSDYQPDPELRAFLDAGPPPVYIGFGSIVLADPDATVEIIFQAAWKTGQRVLISKGWGMSADKLRIPSDIINNIFVLGDVPHDWLFKYVSCVVHHGGAGTTAAGITAGRPTVIVPFFGDQHFWGGVVARAGAGPESIPHKQLTATRLADAINFCLRSEVLERAEALASQIAEERGSETGAQAFHQSLKTDRLRCSVIPSRAAAWRIKRTKVLLSPFAACTLANAKLLDFHDLKLFRPQEYEVDLGPWDPVSGFSAATFGAFSSMVMGVGQIPTETVKALQAPFKLSRQRSYASASTLGDEVGVTNADGKSGSTPFLGRSQTSSSVQTSSGENRSRPSLPHASSSNSTLRSNNEQGQSIHRRDGPSRRLLRRRSDQQGKGLDRDMVNLGSASSDKGLLGIAKAAILSPMEMSVGITKGFHNLPRLWNDDTVRPQERVHDLKSGFKAIGREFGFGMYDGVSGLITQPWRGARREGATGFLKGVGKGLGGLAAKPGAALFGIVGHLTKGVVKEVQNLFGSNVQNYIITSRVAQGYEEWMQSSEAEKQEVIERWGLLRKDLKSKRGTEKVIRGDSRAQQRDIIGERTASFAQSTYSAPASTDDHGSAIVANSGTHPLAEEVLASVQISGIVRRPVPSRPASEQVLSAAPPQSLPDTNQAGTTHVPQTQHLATTSSGDHVEQRSHQQDDPRHSHQQHESATPFDVMRDNDRASLNRASSFDSASSSLALAGHDTNTHLSDSEWDANSVAADDESENKDRPTQESVESKAQAGCGAGRSSGSQHPPVYDQAHLAGTTQYAFEAQRQGEKTARERTEEEIVMEYVKKQSLLEMHHRGKGKGKGRATVAEDRDGDDEDLQKALEASMQGHGEHEEDGRWQGDRS